MLYSQKTPFSIHCYALYLLLLPLVFHFSACKKHVPESEATIILKAFDNEFINFANQIQNKRTYKSLISLASAENVPLPFFASISDEPGGLSYFNLQDRKGVYQIDPVRNEAIQTGLSDSIIIHFRDSSIIDLPVKFIIAEYSEEPSSSKLMFPVRLNAAMYIGGKRVLSIDHTAIVEHTFPVELNLYMTLENYSLETQLSTRLRKRHANLSIKSIVLKDESVYVQWTTNAKLGYSEPGAFYFKRLNMNYSMFPVIFDIKVNNNAISRNAASYIDEFTKHSKMFAYTKKDKRKLGEINLKCREGSDKLDYAIFFNNGSYVYIDDLLLSAREILSVKL